MQVYKWDFSMAGTLEHENNDVFWPALFSTTPPALFTPASLLQPWRYHPTIAYAVYCWLAWFLEDTSPFFHRIAEPLIGQWWHFYPHSPEALHLCKCKTDTSRRNLTGVGFSGFISKLTVIIELLVLPEDGDSPHCRFKDCLQ